MAGARRVEMEGVAYRRLARRACFVCELLAGNPDYSHHVVHRDEVAVAFLNRFPVWPGHLLVAPAMHVEDVVAADVAADRGYLDIPDEEQADLARRLRIGMRLDHAADS
jgi:diadenosine tetraphosphate (Ap4A) HIT family hydrolase